jgi:hypothetical protein
MNLLWFMLSTPITFYRRCGANMFVEGKWIGGRNEKIGVASNIQKAIYSVMAVNVHQKCLDMELSIPNCPTIAWNELRAL